VLPFYLIPGGLLLDGVPLPGHQPGLVLSRQTSHPAKHATVNHTIRVSDPFFTDPDPDPDPAFHMNKDPDPDPGLYFLSGKKKKILNFTFLSFV